MTKKIVNTGILGFFKLGSKMFKNVVASVRDAGVAGSNPAVPTKLVERGYGCIIVPLFHFPSISIAM